MKIGIFGAWRGDDYIYPITKIDGLTVSAVCDISESRIEHFLSLVPEEERDSVKVFSDFDEMLDSGIEAVILCNYFHKHAEYAIRALDRGVHVISECNAAVTLKECVELCEAAERSSALYYYAEAYSFFSANMYSKQLYDSGKLGKFHYGEGEYNHAGSIEGLRYLTPDPYHWRAWMPRTYYLSHSLGPLMYITGEMPRAVNARAVHSDYLASIDFRKNSDSLGMMLVETDRGALFRVTGCAAIPSPSRYRIVGENGSIESGNPGLDGKVYKCYFPWATPEGEKNEEILAPCPDIDPALAEIANPSGHGGGDFWTVYDFAQCVKNGTKPFFDVYRACSIAAVAVLGWKSCINGGKTYKIPDFSSKEERELVRNDDDTPFPDENGNGATLPPAMQYVND